MLTIARLTENKYAGNHLSTTLQKSNIPPATHEWSIIVSSFHLKKLCLVVMIAVLGVSFFVTPGVVTAKAQGATAVVFYVSPNGRSSGNGTAKAPWDLQTALNQPGSVKPGSTIILLQGTYKGGFVSKLKGAAGKYIIVRGQIGKRSILTNPKNGAALQFASTSYVMFYNIEISGANVKRSTSRSESTYGIQVNQGKTSHHIRLINSIIHDVQSQGIGWWQALTDGEIYGCLFFFNGTTQLDHGVYTHNVKGAKIFKDNMVFDNAGYGFHGYAETAEKGLNNLVIQGNTFFKNGSIGYNESKGKYGVYKSNILVGGLITANNPVIDRNYTYYPDSSGGSLFLGNKGGTKSAKVTNNYFAGGAMTISGGASGLSMTGNTVYAPGGLSGFKSSTYSGNQWLSKKPTGPRVFVRPNTYDKKRANITIYNWSKSKAIGVSAAALTGVSIAAGQAYELHNAQDYFKDVVRGTYNGKGIAVPMTNHSVAQPYGLSFKPATTFPEFGAFILIVK
jgi:hypothetical protein